MPSADVIFLEIVRRTGRLSAEQITAAQRAQAERADDFGEMPSLTEVVMDLGLMTEADHAALLAAELGLPVVSLAGRRVAGNVLAVVSGEQAQHYGVMPLALESDRLQLAVGDPMNLSAIDELGHVLSREIDPVVASPSEIAAAISQHYGGGSDDIKMGGSEASAESGDEAASSDDDADEPVIRLLQSIMRDAVRLEASDIHLEPLERRFRLRYRVDGHLREVEGPPKRLQLSLISRVKIMAGMSIAEKRLPQDGRIQLRWEDRGIDLRVSTVPTAHGESVVMRLLDAEGLKPDLAELGLESADVSTLRRLTSLSDGMVLVTGPTGSGKTTTLYSCLHEINRPDRKIITVEDPVEYQLTGINQVPVRSEVGLTFAAALRAMLRQAPNVVMVGEIRDRETAEIAINASLTGHLVFSTLHTNDAPSAVNRLIDLGLPPFLVASALRASVAQRLVRRVCQKCRQPRQATPAQMAHFHGAGIESVNLAHGEGCEACQGTGYRGRVALFEFFIVNPEIERTIHEHAGLQALRQLARDAEMRTLRDDGLRKAAQGVTTLDEVLAATVADTPQNLS
jgi:type IV pilus assembly protein PilB